MKTKPFVSVKPDVIYSYLQCENQRPSLNLQQRLTTVRTWISHYIRSFKWDTITHPWPILTKLEVNDYIILVYVDMITYPCLNQDTGLDNLCK